jgi:hypothetical protein
LSIDLDGIFNNLNNDNIYNFHFCAWEWINKRSDTNAKILKYLFFKEKVNYCLSCDINNKLKQVFPSINSFDECRDFECSYLEVTFLLKLQLNSDRVDYYNLKSLEVKQTVDINPYYGNLFINFREVGL